MYDVRLTVGIELRGDGLPLHPTERDAGVVAIQEAALSAFGGYTAIPGVGAWQDPAGRIHAENSITIDIATDDPDTEAKAHALAVLARDAMHQQAVLLRVTTTRGQFV